jgi:hypothetical protein
MPIEFACSGCGQTLRVDGASAGKRQNVLRQSVADSRSSAASSAPAAAAWDRLPIRRSPRAGTSRFGPASEGGTLAPFGTSSFGVDRNAGRRSKIWKEHLLVGVTWSSGASTAQQLWHGAEDPCPATNRFAEVAPLMIHVVDDRQARSGHVLVDRILADDVQDAAANA